MNHSLTISMCGTGTCRSSSSSCCNELECTSSHLKIENYNFWIHNTSISLTCQGSPQEDVKGCRERYCCMIKHSHQSLLTSTLPHQRKISDEGMLDRHALQLLGRTLHAISANFYVMLVYCMFDVLDVEAINKQSHFISLYFMSMNF